MSYTKVSGKTRYPFTSNLSRKNQDYLFDTIANHDNNLPAIHRFLPVGHPAGRPVQPQGSAMGTGKKKHF